MKKKLKKLLANVLAAAMVVSAVPAMNFVASAEDTDQWRYIDQIDWTSEQSGWSGYPTQKGKTVTGETLTLRDAEAGTNRTFTHGVGSHAYSEVVYDIEKEGIVAFQSSYGVNAYNGGTAANTMGSVQFRVYGDNELLHESGVLKANDGIHSTGEIDLSGYKKLRLVGTDGGNGNSQDWVDWCDAMVKIDPAVLQQLSRVEMTVDSSVIAVAEQTSANAVAKRKSGEVIDFAKEGSLTYSTSDEKIASVDQNGIITGISDGMVQITATAQLDGLVEKASVTIVVGTGVSENGWAVSSPDAKNSLLFMQNADGGVEYMIIADGKIAMYPSKTGLDTSIGDFSTGLTYVGREDKVIDETYEMLSGKQSTFVNKANETTFQFEKDGVQFNIAARAYDDGVAIQYQIIAEDGQRIVFNDEDTTFSLPAGSFAYAQPYSSNCYEAVYDQKYVSALNGNYGMTFLYKTPDDAWVMISEAKHTSQYTGLMVKANGSDELKAAFAAQQNGKPSTSAPFTSPWRVMVLDTPEKIANTQIFENLSDPCVIEDTSWIEAGLTSWTWLNGDPVNSGETYKRYIDFSAEMGWTYILMDDGWNIGGNNYDRFDFPSWYDDVYSYAQEKGVKLLAWLHKNMLNTAEKQQNLIPRLAKAGISGLKIDFFDGDTQSQIQLYEDLMKITAENKMVVNFHGSNLPTGERRTWPHILAREGVFGGEYQHPVHRRPPNAQHYNTLPFTRNAVGPMDFTPLYYNPNVTDTASLASLVTFESGIPCPADKPAKYQESTAYDFFKDIPAAWDDSVVLEGYPGKYFTVARRGGETWYVGGTTVDARTAAVDLSFLGEGDHYAFIYKDGADARAIDTSIVKVTNEDVLEIPCAKAGGFGVKIVDRAPSQADEIILSATELNMEVESSATITATLNPSDVDISAITWSSSDESIASVNAGVVTAHGKEGVVTITATTGLNQDVTASCVVNVVKKAYILGSDWRIRNEFKGAYQINGTDNVTIWPQEGDAWGSGLTTRNLFLREAPGSDFTMTTKLHFSPQKHADSAGLVVLAADNVDALFTVFRRYHNSMGGKVIATLNETPNGVEKWVRDEQPDQDVYLKLEKTGNKLTGSFSYDNESWTVIDSIQTNDSLNVDDLRIGLYCGTGGAPNSDALGAPATFTEFKVNGEAIPFAYDNSYETGLNIKDKVITNAPEATTADEFAELFGTTAPISITDKDGNALEAGHLVGTGCIVTVGTDVLTVVVPGDVDGDGRKGVMDLMVLKQTILTASELDTPNFKAADMDENGKLNIFDLLRIKLNILNGN
ncbi:glycoside hydrolase family 97 catalytic domain-containing protein [Candidatus Soleaferrea massiliensis]|uniref:glycoside hydrolase family 97 catalytic domain-containing protein n=1 Tax=Candidatus Soleaferrea massiliensis TaxID=1470354 RepID=UPI00058EED03|nr:glycoside hydrolase family 97 catalytic domain-containing protein [Candidatus Soleaferrea massiliensis]